MHEEDRPNNDVALAMELVTGVVVGHLELFQQLRPSSGGFTVFGERSGRYVIDPTIIVVTEDVPSPAN